MSFYLPEGGMIYQYGFFEANLTNFLIRFLKSGDTFLDIGAHVGTYTILASKLVGDNGKVYAFEPTPRTFDTLKKNSLVRENIHVYNNAILNEEKEIEFFDYGPRFSAFNTFKKREDENISFRDHVQKISVKTIALDKFCKEKNINPNFIKIDAEGAEYLILNAMEEILKEIKPVISIEVSNTPELKENSSRSIENLYSKGYVGYISTPDGFLNRHIEGREYAYENIIFVHETKLDEVKKLIVTTP
jgi:FkbM family methyltransferase